MIVTAQRARWLCMAAAVLASLAVAWLSLTPPEQLTPPPLFNDKIRHFAAYATLGVLFAASMRRPAVLSIAAALTLYGAGLEVAQGLMLYGREASLADGIVNTLGALAGVGSLLVLRRLYSAATGTSSRRS